MGRTTKTLSAQLLRTEYIDNQKTVNQIAIDQGVSAWKISDLLRKYGIPKRSKAESQRLALEQGRAKHPTKGKKLTKEQREKISDSMSEAWQQDVERAKDASERMKQTHRDMPQSEKERRMEALRKSVVKTSRDGSRTEHFFAKQLIKHGWVIETHRKDLIVNHEMHVDIFVPQARTIIEIDGPTHTQPIYGQKRFLSTMKSDNEKNGLLLSNGFCIIRVREEKSKRSDAGRRRALKETLRILERNRDSELDLVDRLAYVNIK